MPIKLEEVYDFNESDILLNQNSKLSEKQIKLLSEYERINKLGGRLAFVVMFISMALFIVIPIFAVGIDDLKKHPEIAYSCVAVFAIGWLLFLVSTIWGKLRSDIKSRKISSIEGFAEFKTKKVRQWTAYYVTIGGMKFQVETKAKYSAFEPNTRYRIFYIKYPPTHVVLSVLKIAGNQ